MVVGEGPGLANGLSALTGPRLTSDLATPSATRPGHVCGLLRPSSGSERTQTAALNAAVEPYAPISAARCSPA